MGQCPLDSQGNTNNTMKLLGLALLVASASAFDLSKLRFGLAAPPTEIEYGFCDGSPEPASIDNISVEPFPILVQNGASVPSPSRSPSTSPFLRAPLCLSTWCWRESSPSRSLAWTL